MGDPVEERKVRLVTNPHTNEKFIEVDGETYVMTRSKKGVGKSEVFEFEKVTSEYNQRISSLAMKLSEKVKIQLILEQALRDLPTDKLNEIEEELKKPKPVVRNYQGCSFLKIGKTEVWLRE